MVSLPPEAFISDTKGGPFLFVNAVTKIVLSNHTDPYYSDICYVMTREVCDFCCLVDFEFCTRDIGICLPVENRELHLLFHCAVVLGGILCGLPIMISCCGCLLKYRCMTQTFPNVNGVSCYELFIRFLCMMCCVRFSDTHKSKDEE